MIFTIPKGKAIITITVTAIVGPNTGIISQIPAIKPSNIGYSTPSIASITVTIMPTVTIDNTCALT